MKRLIVLILATFIALPVSAEVYYRRQGKTTTIQFANPLVTTGVITTGATYTLTCGCIAEGASGGTLALGACNGGTAAAEIGTTGVYNLTVNSADLANNYCFIKAVAGTVANSPDHFFEIRTADYKSVFDVTNPSGTAVTFEATGGNGKGQIIAGHGSGFGQWIYSQGGNAAVMYQGGSAGAAGLVSQGAGAAPGIKSIGGGTEGNAIEAVADGGSCSKTGNAICLVSTTTTPTATITADAIYATSGGDVISLNASGNNSDAIQLNPNGTGAPINCGTFVCFNGAGLGAGLVRE